jgi:hypothetical protein
MARMTRLLAPWNTQNCGLHQQMQVLNHKHGDIMVNSEIHMGTDMD